MSEETRQEQDGAELQAAWRRYKRSIRNLEASIRGGRKLFVDVREDGPHVTMKINREMET